MVELKVTFSDAVFSCERGACERGWLCARRRQWNEFYYCNNNPQAGFFFNAKKSRLEFPQGYLARSFNIIELERLLTKGRGEKCSHWHHGKIYTCGFYQAARRPKTHGVEKERVGAGNFCFLSKISELITPIPSDGVEIYGARRTQTSSSMRAPENTKKQEVRCLCLGFL